MLKLEKTNKLHVAQMTVIVTKTKQNKEHCRCYIFYCPDRNTIVVCSTWNICTFFLPNRRSNRPLRLQRQRPSSPGCLSCQRKRPKRPPTPPPSPLWPCCASFRQPSTGRAPSCSPLHQPGCLPPGGTSSPASTVPQQGCRLRPCTRLWT